MRSISQTLPRPHLVSCIVAGLGRPEYLVKIDATAYLGDET